MPISLFHILVVFEWHGLRVSFPRNGILNLWDLSKYFFFRQGIVMSFYGIVGLFITSYQKPILTLCLSIFSFLVGQCFSSSFAVSILHAFQMGRKQKSAFLLAWNFLLNNDGISFYCSRNCSPHCNWAFNKFHSHLPTRLFVFFSMTELVGFKSFPNTRPAFLTLHFRFPYAYQTIDLACVKARNPVETLFIGQPWDLQLPIDRASSSLCLKSLRTKKLGSLLWLSAAVAGIWRYAAEKKKKKLWFHLCRWVTISSCSKVGDAGDSRGLW